jgi:segregation and condensation protein A
MDAHAMDRDQGRDELEEGSLAGGKGGTPSVVSAGFSGTLGRLLTLARGQKIDLAKIALTALVDQLVTAVQQAPGSIPLGQKGDWVVMAAWLVQLRSQLLLPADASAQQNALAEAGQLRIRLAELQEVRALAGWLGRRPQLGHDGFARGRPEVFGVSIEAEAAIDVIEFLWASMALFDNGPAEAKPVPLCWSYPLGLYAVAEARERILQRLAEAPEGAPLERLLPDPPARAERGVRETLLRRSAWASTLTAGLELAKQGDVVLAQDVAGPVHVSLKRPEH